MFKNIKTQTLMKIAAIGGFATAAMGFTARNKLISEVQKTEYYQEATHIFKNHPGVIYILGKPILFGKVNVSDTDNNWSRSLSAQYEVPVKGAKQVGMLYFWANRKSIDDKWIVVRIELGLKDEPNKRLLVKNVDIEDENIK